jgi:hypothetical protein
MNGDMERLLEAAVERIEDNLSTADEEFMRLCGQALAAGGADFAADAARIGKILAAARKANGREVSSLAKSIQAAVYDEAKTLKTAGGQMLLPFEEFSKYVKANPLLKQVAKNHAAMGSSSAASSLYRTTVSNALAMMTGGEDRLAYPLAMRKAIRELSDRGMSAVAYASGYQRRLDSSVRADLMDEFTQITQGIERELARAVGTDAWEISAHDHPAEDHEDIQGRVFSDEEFEKLQAGGVAADTEGGKHQTRRPIGLWNCHHIAYPFMLGVSEPAYSRERLAQIRERNEAGVEFRGKKMTLYEATQAQRRVETRTRKERGRLACIEAVAGTDPALAKDLKKSRDKIRELRAAYQELGEAVKPAAIRAKWERTYNVGGRGGRLVAQPDGSGGDGGRRDAPPKPVERNVDYSRADAGAAMRQEFDYLRAQSAKTGNEHMSIMAGGNKILGTWEGTPKGVNKDDVMENILDSSPPDSLDLLHTHTNGAGLSGNDFATMCEYRSIKSVRVQTLDGAKYRAAIGKDGTRADPESARERAKKLLIALSSMPRYQGIKSESDPRWARLVRERNAELKKEYGWDLEG